MNRADAAAFVKEMAPVLRQFVSDSLAPLAAQLEAIERRVESLPPSPNVPDIDMIERAFKAEIREDIAKLRADLDMEMSGKAEKASLDAVRGSVTDLLRTVEMLPTPAPDLSARVEAVERSLGELEREQATLAAAIPPASVTAEQLVPAIDAAVKSAVEALPAPERGAPGVGVAGALIDRGGHLVLTLSNGETADLGPVVGKSIAREDVAVMVTETVRQAVLELPAPEPGKSVTTEDVRPMLAELVAAAIKDLPAPEPARPLTVEDVTPMLREMVASATEGLPAQIENAARAAAADLPATPAEKVDMDEVERRIAFAVTRAVDVLPPAPRGAPGVGVAGAMIDREGRLVLTLSDGTTRDLGRVVGTSVDLREVEQMVAKAVAEAVEELPEPEPGKSITIEDVRPVLSEMVAAARAEIPAQITRAVRAAVGELTPPAAPEISLDEIEPMVADMVAAAVERAPRPANGVGVAGGLIDRDGNLILTLSDGTIKDLGRVVGRDVDALAVEASLKAMFDAWPKPKNGVDGFGFDDLDVVETDEGVVLRFAAGERKKDFRLPVVVDRGVWKLGDSYHRGAGVTHDGSFWISQADGNTDKPGTSKAWRMAVRKGKDRSDPVKLGE